MPARAPVIVLEPDKIVATIEQLRRRIAKRLAGSGLESLATTLLEVARSAVARGASIHAPRPLLRAISVLLIAAMVALLWFVLVHARPAPGPLDTFALVQVIEATLSGLVMLGACALFLLSLEIRMKRKKALDALHELRVLAHVIDMHQLSKDPERAFADFRATEASPTVDLSPFELDRYLNYCVDLLALVGKIAAYYVQNFQDGVVLSAVNEIEDLTNGLSRKIWQKLMLLDQMMSRGGAGPSLPPTA